MDDQRRRILALETERRSLLKAHLAGAVPIDLLQEEQNRISTELANAGALMANAEVHWEYLEKNLDRALAFASNLGDAYAMASPQVRRNLNQSMFEEIAIEVDGSIVHAPCSSPSRPSTTRGSEAGSWMEPKRTPVHYRTGVRMRPFWWR